jgi:hypothetical protein
LTGEAVKVTWVPSQIAPDGFAVMETETGRMGFTTMMMVLEVAGLPVWQVSEVVTIHVIWSPCLSAELM